MYRTRHGLAVAAFMLGSDREVSISEVTTALDIQPQTATRVVHTMEETGYLRSRYTASPNRRVRLMFEVADRDALKAYSRRPGR